MRSPNPDRFPVARVATFAIAVAFLGACQPQSGKSPASEQAPAPTASSKNDTTAAASKPGRQLYQCAMHPNVVSDKPGRCPICGMELQPVTQIAAQGIPGRAPVRLTTLQAQLINIRTAPVMRKPLAQTIRTVGRIVVNEEKTATLNSRVMGWVEQLDVDKTGETVARGQPLLKIYSPALYSAQEDYLIVARRRGAGESVDALVASARKRLELWGISDAQIAALASSGKPTSTLTLTAPLSGTVIEKPVVDAQMVKPGMPLYRIANLSSVWVLADLYESELPFVSVGQDAVVTVPAYPDRIWHGRVDFVYPFLQNKTRTNQARVVLPNPDGRLKPDMYVDIELKRDLGSPLSVPASAIFDTGNRQYVFVEQQPGIFVPVIIELGPRVGSRQVLRSGVGAGDRVVVDGNFLLDSESQLKAAASGPAKPKEAQAKAARAKAARHPLPAAAAGPVADLLQAYARMHDGLFHDSFDAAGPALAAMRTALTALHAAQVVPTDARDLYSRKLDALAKTLAGPPPANIFSARQRFGTISAALIGLLQTFPPPLRQSVTVMHCPMWTDSPADWLQTASTTQNPFYGTQMPTCGNVVGTLGEAK